MAGGFSISSAGFLLYHRTTYLMLLPFLKWCTMQSTEYFRSAIAIFPWTRAGSSACVSFCWASVYSSSVLLSFVGNSITCGTAIAQSTGTGWRLLSLPLVNLVCQSSESWSIPVFMDSSVLYDLLDRRFAADVVLSDKSRCTWCMTSASFVHCIFVYRGHRYKGAGPFSSLCLRPTPFSIIVVTAMLAEDAKTKLLYCQYAKASEKQLL